MRLFSLRILQSEELVATERIHTPVESRRCPVSQTLKPFEKIRNLAALLIKVSLLEK